MRLALMLALLCADPASAQGVLPIRTLTPTIVPARGALGGPVERFYFADEQSGWVVVGGDTILTLDGGVHWVRQPGRPFAGPGDGYAVPAEEEQCAQTHAVHGATIWALCGGPLATIMQSKHLWKRGDENAAWAVVAETQPFPGEPARGIPSLPWTGHVQWSGSLYVLDDFHAWFTLGRTDDIHATSDGGLTWRRYAVGTGDGPNVSQVQFVSPSTGYVYVFTGQPTVRATADSGSTWSQLYPPPWPVGKWHFDDRRSGIGFRLPLDDAAVMRTADGGETWQVAPPSAQSAGLGPTNDTWWRIGADGLEHSDGAGEGWTSVPLTRPDQVASQVDGFSRETAWVVVSATPPATGPRQVLSTIDAGQTWTRLDLDALQPGLVQFVDPDHGWLTGGPYGTNLYRTADAGHTWSQLH
jgi:photosystem II stability/assembly factor-like uncharacterized protein